MMRYVEALAAHTHLTPHTIEAGTAVAGIFLSVGALATVYEVGRHDGAHPPAKIVHVQEGGARLDDPDADSGPYDENDPRLEGAAVFCNNITILFRGPNTVEAIPGNVVPTNGENDNYYSVVKITDDKNNPSSIVVAKGLGGVYADYTAQKFNHMRVSIVDYTAVPADERPDVTGQIDLPDTHPGAKESRCPRTPGGNDYDINLAQVLAH